MALLSRRDEFHKTMDMVEWLLSLEADTRRQSYLGSPLHFLCLIQTHSDASTALATKLLEAGVDPSEGFEF